MRAITGMIGLAVAVLPAAAWAASVTVPMTLVGASGAGAAIGSVYAEDTDSGLKLTPDLTALPPGPHGFHVHQNPSCAAAEKQGQMQAALAAGGHYDPQTTGKHLGPEGDGHKGDLPRLQVDPDGTATKPMMAPRLRVADLKGRALVIHAGSDNYSEIGRAHV